MEAEAGAISLGPKVAKDQARGGIQSLSDAEVEIDAIITTLPISLGNS